MTAEVTAELTIDASVEHAFASPWRVASRRLMRKKLAVLALVAIAVFYFVAMAAPAISPYDYQKQDLNHTLESPSREHPFGTDRLGRDQLSRVIWSARTTAIVTVATIFTGSLVLAVGLGMLAGYAGGRTDTAIMRGGEIFGSLPALPMLILIGATMRPRAENAVEWLESHTSTAALRAGWEARSGPEFIFLVILGLCAIVAVAGIIAWFRAGASRSGVWLLPALGVVVVVGGLWFMQAIYAMPGASDYFLIFGSLSLFYWVGSARVIRSQVLALRETDYVTAAESMGASTWRVLTSHLLPNVSPIIIVGVSASLGAIAGSEIALTFIGVGVHEPTPSFGAMITDAVPQPVLRNHPYLLIFPALCVGMLIFAFNFLGDALNDVLTPRAR